MRIADAFVRVFGSNSLLTVANVVRDVTIAAAFGASLSADVFFLTVSILVFLVTLGSNAFRGAVVPLLERSLAAGQRAYAATAKRLLLVNATGILLLAGCLGLLAVGAWLLPISNLNPASRELFGRFLLAILPMYVLLAMVESCQAPLQVRGQFLAPGLLRLGLPIGMIGGVLLTADPSIFSAAVGGLAGTTVVFLLVLGLLSRNGIAASDAPASLPPEVRKPLVAGYQALAIAYAVTYVNPVVDQWMATLAGEGGASLLGYANRIAVGLGSLVAGSLSPVLLVQFSRYVAAGNSAAIRNLYRLFLSLLPWLACLATLATWLVAELLIQVLYQRGEFGPDEAEVVVDLINVYALQFTVLWASVPAVTLITALSLTRMLVPMGIFLFAVNLVGDLLLLRVLGLPGIPLATVIVYTTSLVIMNVFLVRQGQIALGAQEIGRGLLPVLLLGACWLLIGHLDLAIRLEGLTMGNLQAIGLLAGFAALAGGIAWRSFRQLRATQRLA